MMLYERVRDMILVENVLIAVMVAFLLFLIFNLVNVHSFCKDVITATVLSINLLYLFLVMPFKGVNDIHRNRHRVMKTIKKDPEISVQNREVMRKILDSKIKIFILLYKNGAFSYNELVLTLARWYLDKPFKLRVAVKFRYKVKDTYAQAYVTSLQQELKEAVYA